MERFYGELARWWPQISPPEDYTEEAGEIARLLGDVHTVLELGSGGGCNAFHLKDRYALTLSDLSPGMLEVSERLNGLSEAELKRVGEYEKDNKDRVTLRKEMKQKTETTS